MISASESVSAPAIVDEKPGVGCGVVAASSIPRSRAAVLTSISTPSSPESCNFSSSSGTAEVFLPEGDTDGSFGLNSKAMKICRFREKTLDPSRGAPDANKATMPGLLAQTLEFVTSSRLVQRQNAAGRKEFGTRGMDAVADTSGGGLVPFPMLPIKSFSTINL